MYNMSIVIAIASKSSLAIWECHNNNIRAGEKTYFKKEGGKRNWHTISLHSWFLLNCHRNVLSPRIATRTLWDILWNHILPVRMKDSHKRPTPSRTSLPTEIDCLSQWCRTVFQKQRGTGRYPFPNLTARRTPSLSEDVSGRRKAQGGIGTLQTSQWPSAASTNHGANCELHEMIQLHACYILAV